MKWEPIETAPCTGEEFIIARLLGLHKEFCEYAIAWRESDGTFMTGDGYDSAVQFFTHWAPLEPPQ